MLASAQLFGPAWALASASTTGKAASTTASGRDVPEARSVATAAAQANVDRFSSGDFAGVWQECERSARDALGSDAFEAAHQEGRASTFDEAVAYAIGGTT